jgi:delta 1-pyrroline-5-carboxylate dehydrogenase
VGNLYINRGTTGALVGRQPFGGFGLSGTGSKAGGAEYCRGWSSTETKKNRGTLIFTNYH